MSDGAEYFGFFFEETNLWCYYTVQLEYVCDSQIGVAANNTYLTSSISDTGTDPTNFDSDGDGMPDGWEIRIVVGLARHLPEEQLVARPK